MPALVLAREGVLALVDPAAVPPGPRFLLRLARTIERRNAGPGAVRLATALTRLGPSYVKLGQFLATRSDIVGTAIARDLETLQDRMPPFPQAAAEAAIEEGLGKPVAQLFEQFGPADRRRFDRAGSSRRDQGCRRREKRRRRQGIAAPNRAPLPARSRFLSLCGAACRAPFGGSAAAAARLRRRDARALGLDRNGSSLRSRGLFGARRKHQGQSRFSRARRRLGAHRAARAHGRMGRRHPVVQPRGTARRRPRSDSARPRADPVVSPASDRRRIFPCRFASGKSFRRCRWPPGRGRLRHHGKARAEGAQVSRRDPLRLHHPRLAADRRNSFRGGLCALASFDRGFRAGDPRHRRADPRSAARTKSRWRNCSRFCSK